MIRNSIIEIIVDNENKGKKTELGEIGSRLSKKFPEFDIRNYGYSKLSSFVQNIDGIKLDTSSRHFYISLIENNDVNLKNSIFKILSKQKKMNIGLLKKELIINTKININSKMKSAGYTKFSTYLRNLDGIELIDNNYVKIRN